MLKLCTCDGFRFPIQCNNKVYYKNGLQNSFLAPVTKIPSPPPSPPLSFFATRKKVGGGR